MDYSSHQKFVYTCLYFLNNLIINYYAIIIMTFYYCGVVVLLLLLFFCVVVVVSFSSSKKQTIFFSSNSSVANSRWPPYPVYAGNLQSRNVTWPSGTMTALAHFYNKLFRNSVTKILLIYLCLNTIGMLLQVVVAWTSNSLALLGHAFHTMFDCIGIVVACTAEIYSGHNDEKEPFGFGLSRVPVLAAFTNASFLFFTAIFLALQVLHRLATPEEVKPYGLVFVVLFGLFVKFLGLAIFIHNGIISLKTICNNLGGKSGGFRNNVNLQILLVGAFSDLLRSSGVLIAFTTIHIWQHADTAVSLLISFFMIRTVFPTLRSTSKILLQCAPEAPLTKATVERCVRHLSNIDGVLEVKEERYWSLDGHKCAGTFCIRANENADEQAILENAEALCKPTFRYLNIQIEKDPPTTWFLSKRNS